jgi:hypothetical protein
VADDGAKERIEAGVREAKLFIGGLMAGTNTTVALMHGLVVKGVLRKEEAAALIDEAASKTAEADIPAPYNKGIAELFAKYRSGFE